MPHFSKEEVRRACSRDRSCAGFQSVEQNELETKREEILGCVALPCSVVDFLEAVLLEKMGSPSSRS